ncbi:MAG: ABC transporter permease subunit [Gemmataceae bacterium]
MEEYRFIVLAVVSLFVTAICTILPGLLERVWELFRPKKRRYSAPILGPLFWHELVRLARRGTLMRIRVIYAIVLLIALFVAFLNEFSERNLLDALQGDGIEASLDRLSRFAANFLMIFVFCQLVLIVFITPLYAGGAIAEEKDRKTLEFLQSSMLTNREIVAAKLTARLAYVVSIMATGVPILMLTMLFGGVDGDTLIGSFVIALITILNLTAFGVYLGTVRPSLREVLYWSYGSVLMISLIGTCCYCVPPMSFISPFTVTAVLHTQSRSTSWIFDDFFNLIGFTFIHGTLAIVFSILAVRRIRQPAPDFASRIAGKKLAPPQRWVREIEDREILEKHSPERKRRREVPERRDRFVPRMNQMDPIFWKERYFFGKIAGFERGLISGCLATIVGMVMLPIVLGIITTIVNGAILNQGTEDTRSVLGIYSALAGIILIAPYAGFLASTSVTREREKDTLLSLLTLPVDRREILYAKWYVPLHAVRYWFIAFFFLICSTLIYDREKLAGIVVVIGLIAAVAAMLSSLGIWLSTFCRSSLRASVSFIICTLLLYTLPIFIGTILDYAAGQLQVIADPSSSLLSDVFSMASLPSSVIACLGNVETPKQYLLWKRSLIGSGIALVIYTILAYLLWRDALRRFETEGR